MRASARQRNEPLPQLAPGRARDGLHDSRLGNPTALDRIHLIGLSDDLLRYELTIARTSPGKASNHDFSHAK
jgi:hypothetical protein